MYCSYTTKTNAILKSEVRQNELKLYNLPLKYSISKPAISKKFHIDKNVEIFDLGLK